ncbi:MAG: DUF3667 domain-containing protein [Deltaproteobacteria bacterium]|nr:DUF3667 domain-containing protein [Deltaproteobacteria bacterium]
MNAPRESRCPNCSSARAGRFCATCGQDNQDPNSALDTLGVDFLRNVFSRDAKIWRTMFQLFLRPGALTQAFIAGKRIYYVHPRKLYLLLSIVFFVSISFTDEAHFLDLLRFSRDAQAFAHQDLVKTASKVVKAGKELGETFEGTELHVDAADAPAAAAALAKLEKLSLGARIEARLKALQRMDRRDVKTRFSQTFSHHLPKLIFLLMPVFAWIIALFFGSSEQKYVQHLVFAFHIHAFFFALALCCLVYELATGNANVASAALVVTVPYMILATKRVYEPSLGLALMKLAGFVVAYALALGLASALLAGMTLLWWV